MSLMDPECATQSADVNGALRTYVDYVCLFAAKLRHPCVHALRTKCRPRNVIYFVGQLCSTEVDEKLDGESLCNSRTCTKVCKKLDGASLCKTCFFDDDVNVLQFLLCLLFSIVCNICCLLLHCLVRCCIVAMCLLDCWIA